MRNSFKLAMIYIGMITGAGFLSGQEILSFFLSYGSQGFFGVITASLLFGICSYLVFHAVLAEKISSRVKPRIYSGIIDSFTAVFMYLTYCVMLAGAADIFREYLSLPGASGSLTLAVICCMIFKSRSHGLISANLYLAPIMIFGSLLIASYAVVFEANPAISLHNLRGVVDNWLVSGIFYVSYNVIGSAGLISSFPQLVDSRKTCLTSSVIISVAVFIMCASIWLAMYNSYEIIKYSSIPMLILSGVLKPFYVCLLFIAMLTTAISCGFSAINCVKLRFKSISYGKAVIIVTLSGLFISQASFAFLVSKIYYIYGIIGIPLFPLTLRSIRLCNEDYGKSSNSPQNPRVQTTRHLHSTNK